MPERREFLKEIEHLFAMTRDLGFVEATINAGAFHRRVGAYPGPGYRMPVCRSVMRDRLERRGGKALPNTLTKEGAGFAVRFVVG